MHGLGQGLGLPNIKLPPGYTPLRCYRIPSLHPTSTTTTSGSSSASYSSSSSSSSSSLSHVYRLCFHAKLSILSVATEGGSSSGSGGSHPHHPQSTHAGWGYEWCVVVYPAAAGDERQMYLMVADGACQHVPGVHHDSSQSHLNDEEEVVRDHPHDQPNASSPSSSNSSSKSKNNQKETMLAPWSWRWTQADLGALHAGIIILYNPSLVMTHILS